jgi:hypothetical protein
MVVSAVATEPFACLPSDVRSAEWGYTEGREQCALEFLVLMEVGQDQFPDEIVGVFVLPRVRPTGGSFGGEVCVV